MKIVVRGFVLGLLIGSVLIGCFLYGVSHFQPTVVIAPHHNLVESTRSDLFQSIKSRRLLTRHIILIGPDHFGKNQKAISYSDNDWNLSNGPIRADKSVISLISNTLTKDNNLVKNDHTIYNLLPQIKQYFPNAQLTSILIGQKVDFSTLDTLTANIHQVCHQDCLVIASVDFSHYLPASLAAVHDQKSIRTLNNLDLANIKTLEVDSPQSLFVAASIAKMTRSTKFTLFAHTNSGIIAHDPDTETTTHLFGYYSSSFFTPKPYTNNTFTYLPVSLESKYNLKTVGERFFYGVDEFRVSNRLNQINSTLPSDFVVSGYQNAGQLIVTYLPVTIKGNQLSFDKGKIKVDRVKNLFDSIQFPSCRKDYNWSTIIYDIGKS